MATPVVLMTLTVLPPLPPLLAGEAVAVVVVGAGVGVALFLTDVRGDGSGVLLILYCRFQRNKPSRPCLPVVMRRCRKCHPVSLLPHLEAQVEQPNPELGRPHALTAQHRGRERHVRKGAKGGEGE
jgi:hypothetical protein